MSSWCQATAVESCHGDLQCRGARICNHLHVVTAACRWTGCTCRASGSRRWEPSMPVVEHFATRQPGLATLFKHTSMNQNPCDQTADGAATLDPLFGLCLRRGALGALPPLGKPLAAGASGRLLEVDGRQCVGHCCISEVICLYAQRYIPIYSRRP